MKIKNILRMEIKEVTAEGTFEGMLSPYGNVDHGGDVVEPGAYKKTLVERGSVVPMLWQHKTEFPIGTLTLEDRQDGLWCKGKLQMELPKAQEAYICLKNRIIKGLSIGFETVKDSIEGGIRHLKEIRLFEGSVVTFPMNELAMVTAIKALEGQKGDFNQELDKIQTFAAFWQMQYALGDALRSIVWAEATKDEKISMCNTVLTQFSEAFYAYFPKYLDALEAEYGPSEAWESSIKPEIKAILEGNNEFKALLGAGAGSTTPTTEAAENKSEPDVDHSALTSLIENIKGLLQ
jgi:HK97 family phage prohead protease